MREQPLSPYEKLTFQEATAILYWFFESKAVFVSVLEDLMTSTDPAYKSIAPRWYEQYRDFLKENKKSK